MYKKVPLFFKEGVSALRTGWLETRIKSMKAEITYNNKTYKVDLSKPLDISLSLRGDDKNPIAWYL